MSHELTIRDNGKVEMAFVGEVPWHGLGNELQPGASIEEWIAAAGMDWIAQRARVRFATGRNQDATQWQEYGNRVVLFRNDTLAPLGIVSDDFQRVQPRDVLEFFRDLVGPAGGTLETAGTLFGGRKLWAMARFGADAAVFDGRDKVKQNLLLATALDGSMATEGSWIATRVVCNNTLQLSRGESGAIRVKVNHRSEFNAKDVKAKLGIEQAQTAFEKTMAELRQLAQTPMTPQNMVLTTAELFKPEFASLDDKARDKVLNSKPVQTVGRMALDGDMIGAKLDGVAGTRYGWLNAVTEYVDHKARAQTVDNRLDAAWFGRGAELKERAREMAMAGADDFDERPAGPTHEYTEEEIARYRANADQSVQDWLNRHK